MNIKELISFAKEIKGKFIFEYNLKNKLFNIEE